MDAPTARIGTRLVGGGAAPYVIGEVSGNHNGDLDRALAIIDAVAEAGADAVKLQTYTADTMTLPCDEPPFIVGGGTPWDGQRLYDLYEQAATPWEWMEPLFEHARSLGLDVFSTPFDETAIEFLETLDPPAYKVASFELVDHGLLRSIAGTGRSVIVSTGMADESEISEALDVLQSAGAGDTVLLRCNSAYPASPEEMDLRTIPDMQQRWRVPIGLSDHTLTTTAAVAAVALGACVIEKHVTLARSDGGPDAAFSLEPGELAALVTSVREAHGALGTVRYGPSASEAPSTVFRRSLFVVKDVAEGDRFSRDNVRSIRPGNGLPPKEFARVLGRTATRSLQRGTPLAWEFIASPDAPERR